MQKSNFIVLILLLGFTNLWATPEQTDCSGGIYIANSDAFYSVENTLSVNCKIVNKNTESLIVFIKSTKSLKTNLFSNHKKVKKQLVAVTVKKQNKNCNFLKSQTNFPSSDYSVFALNNKLSTKTNSDYQWVTPSVNYVGYNTFHSTTISHRISNYSNPLGLTLQNTTPFYNKPPPFLFTC